MKYSIMTVGGKGGVGKTTITKLLVAALEEAGHPPRRLFDTDDRPALESALKEKYGDALRFKGRPPRGNSDQEAAYWREIHDEMVREGGVVVDLGAGLDGDAFKAAHKSLLGTTTAQNGLMTLVVVPFTTASESLSAVKKYPDLVDRFFDQNARLLMVANEADGDVASAHPGLWLELEAAAQSGRFALMKMPCFHQMSRLEKIRKDYLTILDMCDRKGGRLEELMQILGTTSMAEAGPFAYDFAEWVSQAAKQIERTGILSGDLSQMKMGVMYDAADERPLI